MSCAISRREGKFEPMWKICRRVSGNPELPECCQCCQSYQCWQSWQCWKCCQSWVQRAISWRHIFHPNAPVLLPVRGVLLHGFLQIGSAGCTSTETVCRVPWKGGRGASLIRELLTRPETTCHTAQHNTTQHNTQRYKYSKTQHNTTIDTAETTLHKAQQCFSV